MTGGASTDIERMVQEGLDQSGTGMYLLDREWRFIFFNNVGQELMPEPAAVTVGMSIFDLYPALSTIPFGDAILRAGTVRVATSIHAFSTRLQGWYEMSCFPVLRGVAVYVRDVTNERQTEELLKSADRRLIRKGALLDAAADAIYVRELDGTVSYWNKGAERILGWASTEILGRTASELLYADPTAYRDASAAVLRLGQWIGVLEQVTRSGRVIQVHCRWQLATDSDGEPSFVLCMGSDLTEFKREQDKNYRAQRMESLGTLAGGIAHDLNNVLTPVLIAVQLLQESQRSDDNLVLLKSIEASVTHGANLIRQVLSFARGEEGDRSLYDIGELVEEVVHFASDTLPKSIEVRSRMAPGLGQVLCDRTQILQILVNLVTNARDAMPEGGILTISAYRRSTAGTDGVFPGVGAADGDVVVEVEDSGSGMDADTASRVFEPFYTTKQPGSGTGLGLSTSLAIARGHGGGMEVYSELGAGTSIQLRLPAAHGTPQAVTDTSGPQDSVLPHGAGQLVVVVDDDDAIRALTQRTLELYGYRTISAENGLEAKRLIGSEPDVDLVLTDMMMPVMDGAALIAHLHEHHPRIPVIAASGLTANVEVAKGGRHSVRFFLPKPFSATELLQSIDRVFGGVSVRHPSD